MSNLAALTPKEIIDLHEAGMVKMHEASKIAESSWYPCGSAWVAIKIRKNAKAAKVLTELGYDWWDYHKEYRYRMPQSFCIKGMGQSMEYAKRCMTAYRRVFSDAGIEAYVVTSID